MSGIVGIYNLDGTPVEAGIVERMTRALAHRGPDGRGEWIEGPVGLGQVMFHSTPESYHDRQPLADETGQVLLVLDGRVDNRVELRAALASKGVNVRGKADSELVLQAYKVWGKSSVDHILGDWAFVIWDKRSQSLFMARDPVGIRPLLYWLDGDRLIFASEPTPLFEHPAARREVNWAVLGDRLTNNWKEHVETFDAGVLRLPAGHFADVENGVFVKQRYWPGEQKEIRYRRPEAYGEHFLSLLESAVQCRLRSSTPVGILLSGGLDSSSITCVAQDILRNDPEGIEAFETLSVVYPGLDCDESTYIDAVIGELDVPSHRIIYSEQSDGSPGLDRAAEFPDIDFLPSVMGSILLYAQRAKERGIKILLDGIGGDELFSTMPWWNLADVLRGGDLTRAYRRLHSIQELEGGSKSQLLLGYGFLPLLPTGSQRAFWRAYHAMGRGRRKKVVPWIDPQFATRWRLQERLNRYQVLDSPLKNVAKKYLSTLFTASYNMVFALEFNNRVMARLGLEKRHPFLDRRLLDYCLAIPEEQRADDAMSKPLLRKALQELLPERIMRRANKVSFDNLTHFQLNSQYVAIDTIFTDLHLEKEGVLIPQAGKRLLTAYRRGKRVASDPIEAVLTSEIRFRNTIT